MKAPSVREGSKENGTQVTGNRIYKGCLVWKRTLPGQALIANFLSQAEDMPLLWLSLRPLSSRLRSMSLLVNSQPQRYQRERVGVNFP
jgi:hypothetical protein